MQALLKSAHFPDSWALEVCCCMIKQCLVYEEHACLRKCVLQWCAYKCMFSIFFYNMDSAACSSLTLVFQVYTYIIYYISQCPAIHMSVRSFLLTLYAPLSFPLSLSLFLSLSLSLSLYIYIYNYIYFSVLFIVFSTWM